MYFVLGWVELYGVVCVGLDWIGLDWIGLGWIGLSWVGLVWIGLDWVELDWVGLDCIGLGCVGFELCWIGMHLLVCDSEELDPKYALIAQALWHSMSICLLLPTHSGFPMTKLSAASAKWGTTGKRQHSKPGHQHRDPPRLFPPSASSGCRQLQTGVGMKAKCEQNRARQREGGWAGWQSLPARICDSWEWL